MSFLFLLLFGFLELLLQESAATFIAEAKTDVTLALKNVMQKFGTAFSAAQQLQDDDIKAGTYVRQGNVCQLYLRRELNL